MRTSFFAGIAQLVERNLAKVEVASSSLVSRSSFTKREAELPFFVDCDGPDLWSFESGAIANRLCNGLQIRLARFDSGSRLHRIDGRARRAGRASAEFSLSVP